jgi:hypothetical protein
MSKLVFTSLDEELPESGSTILLINKNNDLFTDTLKIQWELHNKKKGYC